MFTNQDIATYYDQSHTHYVQHWQLNQHRAMHYGLWWPETRSFGEALVNTQQLMAEAISLQPDSDILDAGCGVGGAAIWLRQEQHAQVTGMTLSAKQVERAKDWAIAAGIEDGLQWMVGDFTQTNLEAESFDVIWAIESVCHVPDKAMFLQEAMRLLRPGGQLVMCDFFRTDQAANVKGAMVLRQWLDAWAIDSLTTQHRFLTEARDLGWVDLHARDLTEAIRPSAKRLHQRFQLGFPIQKLYEWLGNPSPVQQRSVRSARWQWEALQAGLWHYSLIRGRKPLPQP